MKVRAETTIEMKADTGLRHFYPLVYYEY